MREPEEALSSYLPINPFAEDEAGNFDNSAYQTAIACCADAILRMHFGERLVNKIFGRNLQSHAAGLVLVMHYEAELGHGRRPTLALIQQEMGRSRTLVAFFGLLRLAGYLQQEPVPHDGRSTYLVPSARLSDGLRQWIVHHARCCEIVGFARPGLADRLRTDDDWFRLYIGHSRRLLAGARAAMAGDGAWAWFDRFDCGDRIGLVLLRAHYGAGEVDATGRNWAPFGSRQVASQLGISHSHIRNVINQAQENGLLWQDRCAGRVALSPRFLRESEAWFLTFWRWVAETAAEAEQHAAAG
ncbi:hypothetical protein FQV39_19295 [Bosea sp. F3-2]|uniref:hypothetical protein n=1 Tax=Bosea sp. F3-2 TaxID=2599640 RepID=UPI0011EF5CB9|nr:hypothetical protein [Bosea sp. F3-2]QEL24490.1 hypothetical protein FQV39_19295 [Bosea sp. F3-2]